jgi:anaerobic dimethyl sulfoxide reductase subunit B (iron-sulfur subunit)
MTEQLGFYFDASACNGCKACVIACKSENALPVGVNYRKVIQYGGGNWLPHPEDKTIMVPTGLFVYSLSAACMHCEDPLCVENCPAKALTKRDKDGVVVVDSDICIGCRYCEWCCPYGAPQFDDESGSMVKCDFCVDLLDAGQEPFCTSACVMRALEFGPMDELRAKYGGVSAIEPMPSSDITGPCIVITPHRDSQLSGNGTGRILEMEEV